MEIFESAAMVRLGKVLILIKSEYYTILTQEVFVVRKGGSHVYH
jgi:hypothetical protein